MITHFQFECCLDFVILDDSHGIKTVIFLEELKWIFEIFGCKLAGCISILFRPEHGLDIGALTQILQLNLILQVIHAHPS